MNGSDSKSGSPEQAPLAAHVEADDEATYVARPGQLATNSFAALDPETADSATRQQRSAMLGVMVEDAREESTTLDVRTGDVWDGRQTLDEERDGADEVTGATDSGDFTDAAAVVSPPVIESAEDMDDVTNITQRSPGGARRERKSHYLPSLAPRSVGPGQDSAGAGASPSQDTAVPADDPLLGAVLLGRYQVLQRIGVGGMSRVYRGRHTTIGKDVAIKVLSPRLAEWPVYVEGFLQEARAASMLRHPNVVAITDFGYTETGNLPFFVMEYLEGEDLRQRLARVGRMSWPEARAIVLQICSALDSAHRRGIIHRDIKPENCFLLSQDDDIELVKLLDFGIAKVTSDTDPGSLTAHGVVLGTVEYISPERANKQPVDARADIYSLGVLLYHMMTGRTPFYGEPVQVVTAHVYEAPPPPRRVAPDADIPPELEAIILRALSKRPDARYQTVADMVAALQTVASVDMPRQSGFERLPTMPPFMTNLASGASMHPPAQSAYGYHAAPSLSVLAPRARTKWIVGVVLALLLLLIIVWSVIESSDTASTPGGWLRARAPAEHITAFQAGTRDRHELATA